VYSAFFNQLLAHKGTVIYCAECVFKGGVGYLSAHTYSNNLFISPNAFTNTFNWYAPTGTGIKFLENSYQARFHDYIITELNLKGERLTNFRKDIIDSEGYMNTFKAREYCRKKNLTIPSNLAEQFIRGNRG